MTTPVFPALQVGLPWIKRPKAGSTGISTAASGRQVRVGYWTFPKWEWELVYEYLPDGGTWSGVTANDFKTLLGFNLAMGGALTPFAFQDPDEYAVTGQAIATGDGSTTTFTLVKSIGYGGYVGTEPIGLLDQSVAAAIYVDGALKTLGVDYSFSTTNPMAQTITFATAPANTKPISGDFRFLYWVHFKDDMQEFQRDMDRLWGLQKLTLESAPP